MGQWGLGACLLVYGWVLKERNVSNQHGHKVFARFTRLCQFVRVCSRWEMFDRVSLFAKQNMMDRKKYGKNSNNCRSHPRLLSLRDRDSFPHAGCFILTTEMLMANVLSSSFNTCII